MGLPHLATGQKKKRHNQEGEKRAGKPPGGHQRPSSGLKGAGKARAGDQHLAGGHRVSEKASQGHQPLEGGRKPVRKLAGPYQHPQNTGTIPHGGGQRYKTGKKLAATGLIGHLSSASDQSWATPSTVGLQRPSFGQILATRPTRRQLFLKSDLKGAGRSPQCRNNLEIFQKLAGKPPSCAPTMRGNLRRPSGTCGAP